DGIRAFHVTGVQTCALPIWTGITTMRPAKSGRLPNVRSRATMKPHASIWTGFAMTALADVWIADHAPTSRSTSSGKAITVVDRTTTAKTKPMALPARISVHPSDVEKSWDRKLPTEAGGSGPNIAV